MRSRSELLAHIQNTNAQYNRPPLGKQITARANRAGVAEGFTDPHVQQTITADLRSLDFYDQLLTDLELHITRTAREHDPHSFCLLRSIPGVGKILALVFLYEIHDIARFPRVQDFVSYARLVRCPKESAGKRVGAGNRKIGNVHLKWAFSEAACLFLRNNAPAQRYHTRLVNKHGKAKALAILAHKLGRAVYFMLRRREAFDPKKALCPA
jgi:transposase